MERARLSAARMEKGWSQEYVASRLNVDRITVQRWEQNRTTPQPYHLEQLCQLFGKTAVALGLVEEHLVVEQHTPEQEEATEGEGVYTSFRASHFWLRLWHVVCNWPRNNARYHELQESLLLELEDTTSMTHDKSMSRRDALRLLAAMPIEICGLSAVKVVMKRPVEEILTLCAAGVTACWHLRRGRELLFVSDTIARYLPTLKAIAHGASSTQRKAAADLLAQSYLLKSELACHVEGFNEAVAYTRLATTYSEGAEDTTLQSLALRTQAAVYSYANRWEQALQAGEQALSILETTQGTPIPPLVRSYIYGGLAIYQARNGFKQKAFISLGKAHTAFFAQPPDDPAPIWVNHDKANLTLHDGLTHYHLGLQKEALDSLAQIHHDPAKTETVRVEALIYQVMAEVNRAEGIRDMVWCIDRWIQGMEGAKTLQSEQRFNESMHAYASLCAAWPAEPRIKELRAYTTHW